MNVYIIHLGEPKEKYINDAIAEYEKRISAYGKIANISLKPVALSDNPSEKEIASALDREADMIERELEKIHSAKIITLCVEGKLLSSEELSRYFTESAVSGSSSLIFIIGSSFGLSERIKKKSNLRLSFSKMTFPHQLMRVILAEQIYRAFSIEKGTKYHK